MGHHVLLLGNLPDPGIKLVSPVSPSLAGGFFTTGPPGKSILTLDIPYKSKVIFKKVMIFIHCGESSNPLTGNNYRL